MKVKLNHLSEPKSFRSVSHFTDYAKRQIAKFEEITNSANKHNHWAHQFISNWETACRAASRAESLNAISQHSDTYPCIIFQSNLTKLLLHYDEQKHNLRIEGALRILNKKNENQNVSSFGAIIGAAQAINALSWDQLANKKSIVEAFNDEASNHEERMDTILDRDEQSLQEQDERFEKLYTENAKKLGRLREIGRNTFKDGKEKWHKAYDDYVEQLKTQTAVALWDQRATDHKNKYQNCRKWAIIIGVAGSILALVWIFGGFAMSQWAFGNDKTAQIATYSAGSIMLFTFLIWTIRVLVRSMISESHLATDASVRSAMAHTYLALTKDESASQEDRAIILASLFAPVSDGMVKDDGLPTLSPASVAAAAITNPRA